MLGVTVRLTNRVPRGIREPAGLRPATVSRVEGGFDTAIRAGKECRSNNDTQPMKESRKSVPELRGNAQPNIPFGDSHVFRRGRMSMDEAQQTQNALLEEFGQSLERVSLVTGDGGVFNVRVDGEEIYDKNNEGYDEDLILERVQELL